MSSVIKSKAALKQPLQRPVRTRLDSIKNPQPRPMPGTVRQVAKKPQKSKTLQCTNKQCPQSDVVEDDGKLVCQTCGVVVQDGQITSEIQFLDMANGGVAVSGSYVGANEAHARNSALGNSKIAGGMDSREVSQRNGNVAIKQIADGLRLSETHKSRAQSLYKLAININFIQGREINHVAAVCLYIVCRMDDQNRMMLIDFSDALQINVFKLGHTYTTLIQDLNIKETKRIGEINLEGLIYRFADELELGSDRNKVAEEAVQILRRMERDWMTYGRRPAGVCGAAIILAARMNNYRRTVRELVYIAKVTDDTILKRLEEFKYTDSSKLTVTEFLNHGDKLEKNCDPPAFYRQFLPKKKRRMRKNQGTAEDEVSDDDSQRTVSLSPSHADGRRTSPSNAQQAQLDSQMMPPPPIPIDPALLEVTSQRLSELETAGAASAASNTQTSGGEQQAGQRRKRGRPPGKRTNLLPTPSNSQPVQEPAQELVEEEVDVEEEMNFLVEDPRTISRAEELHQALSAANAQSPPATQQHPNTSTAEQPDEVIESTEANSPAATQLDKIPVPVKTTQELLDAIPSTPLIPDEEFADDPEIRDCLLTDAEREIKERIWLHDNADYLRNQQAKLLKKQLDEANGTTRVIVRRKRRRGRMGDMSAYQRTNEDGQSVGPQTPAEAVKKMLSNRGYSKKINYQAVDTLFPEADSSESGSASRRASAAGVSGGSTPRVTITSPTPLGSGRKSANEEEEEAEEDELAALAEEGMDVDNDEDYYAEDYVSNAPHEDEYEDGGSDGGSAVEE
ncbi:transcription factor TFIIIB subunit brf1 [Trapelia coarctata]|nr:transcription factor TFIIIB subunit brf1 [Trapelia coarctata]